MVNNRHKIQNEGTRFSWKKQKEMERLVTGWQIKNYVTPSPKAIKQFIKQFITDLCSTKSNSSTSFWNQIKKCYPTKEEKWISSKVFDVEGTTSSDENSIARGFCTYFTNVAKILQTSLVTLGNTIWRNHINENLMKKIKPENIQFSFEKRSACDLVKTV